MCLLPNKLDQIGTPVVTGTGILFSLFSLLVFLQIILIKRPRTNMFAYFLVATLSDLLNHTIAFIGKMMMCSTCASWFPLTRAGILFAKIYDYLPAAFNDITAFTQVAATIDCYISIKNKFPALQSRLAFYLVTLFIVVYSFAYEINLWLKYDIVVVERTVVFNSTFNYTRQAASYPRTRFGSTIWPMIMYVYSSGMRDLVCFVVLLLFNLLILYEMRSSTRRKKQLNQRHHDIALNSINAATSIAAVVLMHASTNSRLYKASKAESRRAIMVVVSGVNYFLGHTGYFPMVIGFSLNGFSPFWLCFVYVEVFLFYLSNVTCYIAFYFSNKLFRQYTNQNIKFLFYPLYLASRNLITTTEDSESSGPNTNSQRLMQTS